MPFRLFIFLLFIATQAHSASALRINCEGDSEGATVYINGKLKGECPIDIKVESGNLEIMASKPFGKFKVQTFAQTVRVGDGVSKRIELILGAPEWTPQGQKIESERLREVETLPQKAAEGNLAAMLELARRYAEGEDFPKNLELAHDWTRKAAETGHSDSQYQLAKQFENGVGVAKDTNQATAIYLQCANSNNQKCIDEISKIEERRFQEDQAQAQKCDSQCRKTPEIRECVENAKNFLGDTFTWNIESRQLCINTAYMNCYKRCNPMKGKRATEN